MFSYLKLLIDRNAPEALHNYCALGSFFVVSGVVLILTVALLMGKSVGVEFSASLATLATYSGYLVKKGNETIEQSSIKSTVKDNSEG